MSYFRAAFYAALFFILGSVAAWSQDITLTSRDGSVEISGTILGFDGEYYRLDSIYGELTVDGSGVLCEGPGCPNLTAFVADVRISGAKTMGTVLMPALVEAFARRAGYTAKREPNDASHFTYLLSAQDSGQLLGRFHFHATSTDEGFADLLANEADIVLSLREVRPVEAKRAHEAGMGDLYGHTRARVLALDALVPAVSDENPVTEITTPQLARVFAGEIANWTELGGPDAPITVYMRDEKSGLGQAVVDRLMRPIKAELSPEIIRLTSDEALTQAIIQDPFGLGMVSAAALGLAKPLSLSGKCGFALSASRRAVKTEDYPLNAPLFLYLPARRLPKLGREFLSYLRTPAAQLVIRRAGFVDQLPEEISINEQGRRFANAIARAGDEIPLEELQRMVTTMTPYSRLTTTFRFEAGSTQLDAQSRSNIDHLASALEEGAYDNRELVFIGFSDGDGAADINQKIAQKRAKTVSEEVTLAAETADFDRVSIRTEAFGEAMPMACDDNAWGRSANRRVEVWVR